MCITPRYRRPPFGQQQEPEVDDICPICGRGVIWWWQAYEKDGDTLYHLKCRVREDDDYGNTDCSG